MSIRQIIPSLIAASLLVLATGCGVENEDPTVSVHPIEIDDSTGAPVFNCIVLSKDMALVPRDRMVPVKVHPGVRLDNAQITAHEDCYETVINVHPSVVGADEVTIVPRTAASSVLGLHRNIAATIDVVWLAPGAAIANLLPADVRTDEFVVVVPNLFDFPYIADDGAHEVTRIDDAEFRNDAPEFEVVTPGTLDATFTLTENTLEDDEDDEDDEDIEGDKDIETDGVDFDNVTPEGDDA